MPAGAQRRESAARVAPPQPVELNLKVRREGKTEIPLAIYGRANEPLKFLIRTAPVHGRVSEPRATGRETAAVIYEPPADLTLATDKFFYAAQSVAGVSAAVEVAITILDQPPQLTIPDALEFPALRTGGSTSRLLEITNSGGGTAVGEVIVEKPWRIDGQTGYRLGAGAMAIFKVHFAPTASGLFEKVARFTSDPAHSTTLRGSAESSVAVEPPQIILRHEVGDPVRTSALALLSQIDEPRTLQLRGDPRLHLPPQIHLPARGRVHVPMQIAAGDIGPLDGEIVITAPDLELRVPVKADAPGAIVRSAQPIVAFGRVAAGPVASVPFELENIGGTPGEVAWKIGAPFRTPQNSALLLPGEKRRFPLEIESRKPGQFRAWLQCQAGAQTFEIPVEAEVSGGARGSASLAVGAEAASPADPQAPGPDETIPRPRAPFVLPEWLTDHQPPPGVKVTGITPTSATLEWPASLSPATRFRVEYRVLGSTPDGRLQITWQEILGLEIKALGPAYATTIRDLQPAQPWALRVLPLTPDGEPGERLFAIDFHTPPKPSLLRSVSPLGILFVALAGLITWQIVARWRRAR